MFTPFHYFGFYYQADALVGLSNYFQTEIKMIKLLLLFGEHGGTAKCMYINTFFLMNLILFYSCASG